MQKRLKIVKQDKENNKVNIEMKNVFSDSIKDVLTHKKRFLCIKSRPLACFTPTIAQFLHQLITREEYKRATRNNVAYFLYRFAKGILQNNICTTNNLLNYKRGDHSQTIKINVTKSRRYLKSIPICSFITCIQWIIIWTSGDYRSQHLQNSWWSITAIVV